MKSDACASFLNFSGGESARPPWASIQAAHPDWEVFTLIPPADKGENMQFYIRKCGFQLEKVEMDGRVQVARLILKKAHPARKTRV